MHLESLSDLSQQPNSSSSENLLAEIKNALDQDMPKLLTHYPEDFEHLSDELFSIIKEEDQHYRHLHNRDQNAVYARADLMREEIMAEHQELYREKEEEWIT